MTTSRIYQFAIIGFIFGIVTYLIPFILPDDTAAPLVKEDSILEYLSSLFFFLAGVFFLVVFFKSSSGNKLGRITTHHNYIFLGLALLFFFGAGEEISWGQRILGFGTPAALEDNVQEEFTIHNLPIFDPTNDESILKMNRLFIVFWFGFAIVTPLIALLFSRGRELLETLGAPLVPLLLGWQFLLFYILSKLWEPLGVPNDEVYGGRVTEIRETQHALLFMLIAILFFLETRRQAANNHQPNEARASVPSES